MTRATSRRRPRLTTTLVALAAALVLAACGSPAAPSSSDATAPSASAAGGLLPAPEGTATYPMTLTSPWGETVLPKRPERIATVGYINDLDNTLALGVIPVWADKATSEYPWTAAAGADRIETLGELGDTFPFEDIAASRPDLIVAVQTDPDQLKDSYERLSSIAPVLVAPEPGFDVSWQDTVRLIGSALDLTGRADSVVSDSDAKIAQAAAANPAFAGRSLSFLVWLQGKEMLTFRSFDGSPTQGIFSGLGFAASPAAGKFSRSDLVVSAENYGLVDADVLLVASPGKQLATLEQVPTFANLSAVKQGHLGVLDLDSEPDIGWAAAWPSALNVGWMVDRVTPALAEAVG